MTTSSPSLPTLEQYQEALQTPQIALLDPELRQGSVTTTGLGLPLALCGGFALTYTVTSGHQKYAVRCFHKKAPGLDVRYRAISDCLASLHSPYFIDFKYQPQGILVQGIRYPTVKMAWASGNTLGDYLDQHHGDRQSLENCRRSLQGLANFLERTGIAHGDIQPGNVMIADGGRSVQLIDYDGMYVPALQPLGASELGHRNFQHILRNASLWNARMDRFSFIMLDLALRALADDPGLWKRTQSDGDAIVFKANDYANPRQSAILSHLQRRPALAGDINRFISVCEGALDAAPSLEDFLAGNNLPGALASPAGAPRVPIGYLAAYPVLEGTKYGRCSEYVGERVELIGRIYAIKLAQTRQGRPYVFLNFSDWRGDSVKISIWSDGLARMPDPPNASWIGRWISVTGLMDPPYCNSQYHYRHLSVTVGHPSEMHFLEEKEARFRLDTATLRSRTATPDNRDIGGGLGGMQTPPASSRATPQPTARTSNQAILDRMKQQQPGAPGPAPGRPAPANPPLPAAAPGRSCVGRVLMLFVLSFLLVWCAYLILK